METYREAKFAALVHVCDCGAERVGAQPAKA